MSTSPASGLQHLKRYADATLQARLKRRALLRTSVAGAAGALLGCATTAAPVEPPGPSLVMAQGLAPGTALVTSHRLPLHGIGASQVAPLLQGDISNWSEVGSPNPIPVSVIALDGVAPDGATPTGTSPGYDALVETLDREPGGMAMVPLDMIDARVNTLDLDGVSPLDATGTESGPIIRIGVAGDIIFGRKGGDAQMRYADWAMPMYQVKDFMATFDVTVSNFECFVSETIDLSTVDPYDFVTRPESLQGLAMAGLHAVTMANNHAVYSYGGYGIPGMRDTMMYLNEAGITPWGVGMDLDEARAPWTTEVDGVSIAFYGVDGVTANLEYPDAHGVQDMQGNFSAATASQGGTNPLKLGQNLADIERLAGQFGIVLPYFHMGDQYRWTPRDWVMDVSRRCVDAGATAVLSAHPHATMGMELYKSKPIFYSIGNFVYDQMFSLETREGYFLELVFRGRTLIGIRIHPTEVIDFVQPRFLSSRARAGFMDRFWRSTDLTRAQLG